ncbi:MAG: TonB family protein [Sandaracinaceae bacterium]|nr:TonB family protein [Sandaracinaceae bacterium]
MRRDVAALVSVLVSGCLHLGLMAWLDRALPDLAHAHAWMTHEARLERVGPDGVRADAARGDVRADEIPVEFGGPDSAQNVDRGLPGGGGEARAPEEGVLLAMNVDDVRLQDAPWNAVGVAQVQRIHTDASRASWDNRRATPNPHDQPFLATGTGSHRERRRVSILEPNEGAPRAGTAGAAPADAHSTAAPLGSAQPSPGTGIAGGQGARESAAARVATGRPAVDEGPAATLATARERPRDDTDSEQLATQLMQSWVDASPRTARERAAGNGGVGGGGPAGSGGGRTQGGEATPHAPGPGGRGALDTRDSRYQSWLLAQRRRVYGAMVFPRERQLQMDQGVVVYTFSVDRSGHLVGAPRLSRSSGYADIDAAALRAIRETLPTAPPPSELMQDRTELPVRMHLNFSNPMVR